MSVHRQILDAMSTSLFLLDQEMSISYLNESAESLIQSSANQVCGQPLSDYIARAADSPAGNDLIRACYKSLDEKSRVWLHDIEIEFPKHQLSRQADCHIFCIDPDSTPTLIVEINCHNSDGIRNPGNDRIDPSQAMIRGLAHEIRNPLGGMRGAAQLLANELPDRSSVDNNPTELRQYTDIIIREADRLSALVARMQASVILNSKQQINIHRVLEQVRKLLQSGAQSKLPILTDYDPSLPDVLGDHDQLSQAFINIMKNAEDAIVAADRDGAIILKTRIDHQILPGHDYQQQVVRVDVCDSGDGIDKHLKDHIFTPMVTGKPCGTGLGLSITSEIIRNHGGLITVQSERGNTIFSIWLKTGENDDD